jgi:hypothetical protein
MLNAERLTHNAKPPMYLLLPFCLWLGACSLQRVAQLRHRPFVISEGNISEDEFL